MMRNWSMEDDEDPDDIGEIYDPLTW